MNNRTSLAILFFLFFLFVNNSFCQTTINLGKGHKLTFSKDSMVTILDGNKKVGFGKVSDGMRQGPWEYYNKKSGNIVMNCNYTDDLYDGLAIIWNHNTNDTVIVGKYDKGKKVGEWFNYSFTNGSIYNILNYKNDVLNGSAKFYDTIRGHVISEGKYENGKRTGLWTFYAIRTGKMHGVEHYENDLMEGSATYYDTMNDCNDPICGKIANGQYRNNLRVGVWTFYDSKTGIITARETYKDSILNGVSKYYTESGKLETVGEYKDGIEVGTWKYYDTSTEYLFRKVTGNADWSTIYYTDYFNDEREKPKVVYSLKDEIEDGITVWYDSLTGFKLSGFIYDDGDIIGSMGYNDKGIIEDSSSELLTGEYAHYKYYLCTFFKDCPTKKWELFSPVKPDDNNKKGSLDGLHRYYYKFSNKVQTEYSVKNGKKNGKVYHYDSLNGERLIEGSFKNGMLDGYLRSYMPGTDVLLSEIEFNGGLLDGDVLRYDSSGVLISKASYKKGIESGNWRCYYSDNKQTRVNAHFKDGKLDGVLKSYYHDGSIKRMELYDGGKKISGNCFYKNGDTAEYYPMIIDAKYPEDVQTYIRRELKYPKLDYETQKEGKVIVGFTITEEGLIKDVEIQQGIGGGFDAEAIRLISHMENWEPAYLDGVPVTTHRTLPVVFWFNKQ